MRPLLALAVAVAFLAAAVFGFGHGIGAWEDPAPAEPPAAAEPVAGTQDEAPERKKQVRRERRKDADRREKALPAAVVAEIDALCRRARVDAERIARGARPTSTKALRGFFERLGRLSRGYNEEALEALRPHADDPRARTLARLFAREERLFDRLLAALGGIESAAGRARFELLLARLRGVGLDEAEALGALGARSCDPLLAH